jgi:exodeoxyribonuclease V alpha subunit
LNQPHSIVDEIFNAFNEYRILCALRRGLNGSELLSDRVEVEISKLGFLNNISSNTKYSRSWYHGRPVMITQNSYSKGLFNGDTGIALVVDKQLKVYFPDNSKTHDKQASRYKSFSPIRLPAHETTWAMTIHKSQGSEFNQVALVLPHEVMPLLTKQLIYTGITRAKKKVTIITSDEILKAGVMSEAVTATRIADEL